MSETRKWEYPEYIIKQAKSVGWTPRRVWIDTVQTNLRICETALVDARTVNWGRHSHEGNRNTMRLASIMERLRDCKPASVIPYDLHKAAEIRRTLCDIIWQARAGV
jgi:hypothetical protein